MNHNQLAIQQRKNDTGRVAELHLVFSPLEDARYFPDTASTEEAHDEDAQVLPSFEALIQAVLNRPHKVTEQLLSR